MRLAGALVRRFHATLEDVSLRTRLSPKNPEVAFALSTMPAARLHPRRPFACAHPVS